MRKLIVFNSVSLDGYFTDRQGDMSWAHKQDKEWNDFVAGNASGEGELVFGRVTYEMMASYWPTSQARKDAPAVAGKMNDAPKIVFSRKMKKAAWKNTRLIGGDIAAETRKLKAERGPLMVLMGSGTIVSQLTRARLIDEYQLVVNPIVLGDGKTLFEGAEEKMGLKLVKTRAFGNGNVLLCYEPVK